MPKVERYEAAIRMAMLRAVHKTGVRRIKSGEFFGTNQRRSVRLKQKKAA
ncbi:hypothetical protein [Mameliella sp.]